MKRIDVDLASGLQAFEAKHFTRAMQLLSPLAEEGNLEAQHRCAIMYQNGLGNKENPLLAFKWMKKAAESGHPLAQHGLGFMYMEGDCTEQNGELAHKDLFELIERLKNVESEHTSSELSRLGTKSNIKD